MKKKPSIAFILLVVIVNIFLLGGISYASIHFFNDYRERKENEENILTSTAPNPVEITANFNNKISDGSPLIFGGVHHPPLSHEDAWNKLQQVGVTSMRTDFNIEYNFAKTVTLEDYKTNKNDIANPAKWNQKHIEEKRNVFKKAKEKGMKTIGILAYAPTWLTYSNTQYGVPKDWDVYKDVVKKQYSLYRDYLDYIEIWNEPNLSFFLNVKDSNATQFDAYKKMYEIAALAIKEVDKEKNDGKFVKIGGPVSFIPTDTQILEAILSNPVSSNLTDFISYHNYEHIKEPSDAPYRTVLQKYKSNKPIYISEWNVTPKIKEKNPLMLTAKAINYTANKFIAYLEMGIAGANYHSLKEVKENSPRGDEGFLAFYHWKNEKAELLPQSKTWHLFSQTLGLGKGPSTIFEIESNDQSSINAVGFTNSNKQSGLALVNNTEEVRFVEVIFNNVVSKDPWKRLLVYEISGNTLEEEKEQDILFEKENSFSKKMFLPPESVTGIMIEENVNFYEKLQYRILSL